MNKADVLALTGQVKELVAQVGEKLSAIEALPEEVVVSDDEEKAQLKAKVEELVAQLQAKDSELASVKESLSVSEAKLGLDEQKIEKAKEDLA